MAVDLAADNQAAQNGRGYIVRVPFQLGRDFDFFMGSQVELSQLVGQFNPAHDGAGTGAQAMSQRDV
ncbi:hypothetical protein NF714_07155 [Lactobacillus delbrueckii]|nr:hypothetical protein [Lactobacillus delbrueckii]MCO0824138.1 hypothetical protein [Lactobacillus delbrueckii]